jgi:simple sugar transport system permease protein
MPELLTETFVTALLFGAVTAGMPLLLAGIGEQISEKAGVLNIGLERMMLVGAYSGFCAANHEYRKKHDESYCADSMKACQKH